LKIENLFPVPFAQIENPYMAAKVRPFIKDILDDPNNHSNVMNYTSTFDPIHKIENRLDLDPCLLDMKDYLFGLGRDFLTKIGYNINLMALDCDIHFNRMNQGDSHQKHLHSGNIVASGTFYVDFPVGSSPLVLHDPKLHREMLSYPFEPTDYTKYKHHTNLRTGSICIMEGYIQHEVEPNTTDGRTVVLFNLINR